MCQVATYYTTALNSVYLDPVKSSGNIKPIPTFSEIDYFRSVIIELFMSLNTLTVKRKKNPFVTFHNQDLEHMFEQKGIRVTLDCDLTFN